MIFTSKHGQVLLSSIPQYSLPILLQLHNDHNDQTPISPFQPGDSTNRPRYFFPTLILPNQSIDRFLSQSQHSVQLLLLYPLLKAQIPTTLHVPIQGADYDQVPGRLLPSLGALEFFDWCFCSNDQMDIKMPHSHLQNEDELILEFFLQKFKSFL